MKTKKLLVLALAIALIVSSIGFAGAEDNHRPDQAQRLR